MMLVVLAVTTATVYFAERNRRANHQRTLDAQFENRVQSFLKIQETQSATIADDCASVQLVRTKYGDFSIKVDVLANMITVGFLASVISVAAFPPLLAKTLRHSMKKSCARSFCS